MYGVRLTLRPTGALTFRVLPGSILDIDTYPFVPPSTLSGWLYRLWRYAKSAESQELAFLETDVKDSPFYYLPKPLVSLGAYAENYTIHRTRRHGTKGFSSRARSMLVTDKMEAPQLHTWTYLFADRLSGYVLSAEQQALETLRSPLLEGGKTLPLGGKLGKEGYAYLEEVGPVVRLAGQTESATPQTLLPLELTVQGQLDFQLFTMYRPVYSEPHGNWQSPAPVEGFEQFPMAWPERGTLETTWWVGEGIQVPHATVEAFSWTV